MQFDCHFLTIIVHFSGPRRSFLSNRHKNEMAQGLILAPGKNSKVKLKTYKNANRKNRSNQRKSFSHY